jgi:hypothetical protein
MTATSHQNALPPGTVLMEYRLMGLLGSGAFGITYLARDTHLDKDVAIKEYLPSAFATRAADSRVVPITQQQAEDYRWGLERFSQEARTLARFSHPHIVRVNRYFESHGTGYMVMDYECGESLKAVFEAHPFPAEATLKAIVGPLLDGLEKIHAAGFLHRDIKPDNIFLRQDGGPVLIDFGSARQAAGESGQALTTIVTPGYAPFEQYTTSKQQGPWSDIYSLGGVLFFLVTGHSPPDAITRMKGDALGERLAQARERYSPALIEAIAWSLAVEEKARPCDVATWRKALLGSAMPERNAPPSSIGLETVRVEPRVPTAVLRSDAPGMTTVHLQGIDASILLLEAEPADTRARSDAAAQHGDWPFGYLLLMVVTGALGALIGKLPAFQETQMMEGRLNAAMLAQLLAAGGTIVFLWLLGRSAALRFRAAGGPRAVLYDLSLPIMTLVCQAVAWIVLQKLLGPALEETLNPIYAWGFLLGTCACAVWLSMAVFSHVAPLRKLLHGYRQPAPADADSTGGDQGGLVGLKER